MSDVPCPRCAPYEPCRLCHGTRRVSLLELERHRRPPFWLVVLGIPASLALWALAFYLFG